MHAYSTQGGLAQSEERNVSNVEAPGSKPGFSIHKHSLPVLKNVLVFMYSINESHNHGYLTVAQLVERGTVNVSAVIPRSMVRIRPVRFSLCV